MSSHWIIEWAGFPFPGVSRMDEIAEAECLEASNAFVGLPYHGTDSILDIYFLRHTRESWEELDDRIQDRLCFVPPG